MIDERCVNIYSIQYIVLNIWFVAEKKKYLVLRLCCITNTFIVFMKNVVFSMMQVSHTSTSGIKKRHIKKDTISDRYSNIKNSKIHQDDVHLDFVVNFHEEFGNFIRVLVYARIIQLIALRQQHEQQELRSLLNFYTAIL